MTGQGEVVRMGTADSGQWSQTDGGDNDHLGAGTLGVQQRHRHGPSLKDLSAWGTWLLLPV